MLNTTPRRVAAAVARAHKLYPGPVAETIAVELRAWESHEGRFGGHGPTARLLDHLLRTPLPAQDKE